MAKGGRKPGASNAARGAKPPVGKAGPKKGSGAKGRKSIASARRSSGDKIQLLIGGVAIIAIIAVIAVGLVMYSNKTAVQEADYGSSVSSTATVTDDGVITVSNGDPELVLDIYEDAICPYCAKFEAQFGQQIAKAIDDGELTVQFHMVDFLNASSASGDYSTRAVAAMLAVAKIDGEKPGVLLNFHSALFDEANQPEENGSEDLSNEDLAALAGFVGASDAAKQAISNGDQLDAAKAATESNWESLKAVAAKVGRGPGTPTIAKDGVPISTASADWLTNLLAEQGSGK